MMITEARTSPTLLAGYILLAALVIVMPFMTSGAALELSNNRIGLADRFTTVVAYFALVFMFVRAFWFQSAGIAITPESVYALILGIVLEGAGLVMQGAYWLPWYAGKPDVLNNPEWVAFSNTNVWLISPAFILIWIGIGFTANMAIRSFSGRAHVYWPMLWAAFIVTLWSVGYQLPDLIGLV